jgi:hypothetical protein
MSKYTGNYVRTSPGLEIHHGIQGICRDAHLSDIFHVKRTVATTAFFMIVPL